MTYLIDANVFIAAKNLHYGLDFCPAFWEWLIAGHQTGRVFSIEKVGDELAAGADELSDWANALSYGFFLKPDASTISALSAVATWATGQSAYSAAAKSNFLQVADYYLVAQALEGQHIVVTHEQPRNSVNRIMIPSVCLGVGVSFLSPFEMLRRERAKFILGA